MNFPLKTIAYARNGFHDKFGIPRQTLSDTQLLTRIVFTPEYRVREALRGIEGFSHLWLLWGFHRMPAGMAVGGDGERVGWSPTVRPPRLGGNIRMGVFATRSPNRPNPIGLSSVRLLRVEDSATEGRVLVVSGADMMDGTPVYDIKPYLAYTDAHPDAMDGFAGGGLSERLQVVWECVPPQTRKQELEEVLSYDPRPRYQDDADRIYRLDYAGYAVSFRVEGKRLIVVKCTLKR